MQAKGHMEPNYNLNKNELFEVLHGKGIENLYHANTIATSITFLNQKSLLSRKYVADNGLLQTEQYSDEKDKKYDIWDGIFLDAMDIHTEFRWRNKYGPFLFSFNTELLTSEYVNTVRVTKMNPVHWKNTQSEDDWYYSDLEEFKDKYKKGNKSNDVGSMIILKDINGKVPLLPFINKFIFDNPNVFVNYKGNQTYLADIITEKLFEILTENNFQDIQQQLRHKNSIVNCSCWAQYKNFNQGSFNELKKLFHPTP